jgi:hypothetical protein
MFVGTALIKSANPPYASREAEEEEEREKETKEGGDPAAA